MKLEWEHKMNIEKNDSTVTMTVTEDITSVTVPEIRDQILKLSLIHI